ncbi:HEAT repeat domain-containing protein [Acidobacteriota bacterium]
MSLFDWLGLGSGKPTNKKIQKTVKTLTHKYVDAAKRWGAAEQLAEWGTPEAIYGLLQRFSVSVPSATVDDDEKKAVRDMLCSLGQKAVEPILKFMKDKQEVNWPLSALERLVSDDEVIGYVLDILEKTEITFARDPTKKVELLNRLKESTDERVPSKIVRFLDDTDDEVVLVALDLLAEAADEELLEKLWEAYKTDKDRPRVQLKILELFTQKEWKVKGGDKAEIKRNLPPGFYLTKKGLIKRSP